MMGELESFLLNSPLANAQRFSYSNYRKKNKKKPLSVHLHGHVEGEEVE